MAKGFTSKDVDILIKIYDAVGGIVSEMGYGAFDRFYKGGGKKMEEDFATLLSKCGVVVKKPVWTAAEYERTDPNTGKKTGEKAWGVCSDPDDPGNTWVLTGLRSKEEAEKIIKDIKAGKYD